MLGQFKRQTGEDENAYIWRVCDNKELIGTWKDVCDLLNNELGYEYNESKYRKAYQSFNKLFEVIKDKYINNDISNELERKTQEMLKEKYRLADERAAYNKMLRTDARLEKRLDDLEIALGDFGKYEYSLQKINGDKSNVDLLVILSDLHIGQTFDSLYGSYSVEIAKDRLEQLLNEVLKLKEMYGAENCYVSLQGDNISGVIHKSLAITNQENVIEQIKTASELVTSFVYQLSKEFNHVTISSVSGNHSRLDRKEDALKDERLDDIVIWYLKTALQYNERISVIERNEEETFSVMDIRGKKYVGVHGDYDSFTKNGLLRLVSMLGFFPYAVTFGHLHTCAFQDEQGIKMIRGGSLAGCGDDYTTQKRLVGKASQMVCACDEEGVKAYHIVELK